MSKFLFFLSLIVIIEITGEMTETRWLIYCSKPLIMLTLLTWAICQPQVTHRRIFFAGMVFGLLGDVFLMIREVDLFAFGLSAFFIMQICYIIAFWHEVRSIRLLPLLSFALYCAVFLGILYRPFHSDIALKPLWWPVVGYGLSLTTMGITAAMRRINVGYVSYRAVFWGAIFFIFSDSIIALNKFLTPVPLVSLLIMSTYAAAQYLLVVGFVNASTLLPTSSAEKSGRESS
jgi:uncharacterized membrane protein YhhN